jgi:hypothetical protein
MILRIHIEIVQKWKGAREPFLLHKPMYYKLEKNYVMNNANINTCLYLQKNVKIDRHCLNFTIMSHGLSFYLNFLEEKMLLVINKITKIKH